MKHVSILLLSQVNLAGMDNPRQSLLRTNDYLRQQGLSPMFEVEVVGVTPEMKLDNGLYSVKPDKLVTEVTETDIIIIPPVQGDITSAVQANSEFFKWISYQYKNGAQVVSLCLGAFILAGTGLLDGKNCVTHWRAAAEFSKAFPKINLLTDKILTDENGIYTGGGAFSSANIMLYLIEKTAGREASVYCSKIFQVDMGRNSQSPFIIFRGQKDHGDEHIKQVQHYIEEHYPEKITVNGLCHQFGIARRTFERRFKKATDNTVVEYIQRVKVEAAKRELEKGHKTVGEVMLDVGYVDIKAFRDVFKKYAGLSPIDYRNRYVRRQDPVLSGTMSVDLERE